MAEYASAIYSGKVVHQRFTPKQHRFVYRVFSLCIDLDELPRLSSAFKWLGINRFGLFSFHEKDHGRGDGQLRQEITALLSSRGHATATANIKLLCYPRILGYTFNPLSVYFCYNAAQEVEVILYEVSNTFGQRHSYLLKNASTNDKTISQHCQKQMYVSPFMPMQTAYHFNIRAPQDNVTVCIQQSDQDSELSQPIFNATFAGQRQPLTDRNLLTLFFSRPLMTFKVIGAIHWEALRLWLKGMQLQPRHTSKSYSISWLDSHGEHHYENLSL
ncbi:DUF1365 domain-containing protein [Amphritea sp. 1_MG-2023]|uniref:DUF1365 domain-containing protein n=1 Tax=Amphritea sp. 1_MG-2023 TaxID=3062670 RepID=UPI0026E34DD2|nr:DUF1365 domain-containing protein [Amphritea sp. 1_MG-2023]MDO6563341.1 DUF1365 domain-containing protein [Amphritea sp. 1_MG-2023]